MINLNSENFNLWSNEDIQGYLDEFIKIYENRPIKNNKGGMQFSHMFYFFFILKKINPDFIIESGVYKGQSTWLIENTSPNSKILSIDIDLSQREYISEKATYSSKDLKFQSLKEISPNSLIFLDDHVNHLDRLIDVDLLNIKHIILEDNYPGKTGDFQTLKQIIDKKIFQHNPGILSLLNTNLKFFKIILSKILNKKYNSKEDIDLITKRIRDGHTNKIFIKNVLEKINNYYEFPPLSNLENINFKTIIKKPLINDKDNLNKIKNFKDKFNFFTYVNLK